MKNMIKISDLAFGHVTILDNIKKIGRFFHIFVAFSEYISEFENNSGKQN